MFGIGDQANNSFSGRASFQRMLDTRSSILSVHFVCNPDKALSRTWIYPNQDLLSVIITELTEEPIRLHVTIDRNRAWNYASSPYLFQHLDRFSETQTNTFTSRNNINIDDSCTAASSPGVRWKPARPFPSTPLVETSPFFCVISSLVFSFSVSPCRAAREARELKPARSFNR